MTKLDINASQDGIYGHTAICTINHKGDPTGSATTGKVKKPIESITPSVVAPA